MQGCYDADMPTLKQLTVDTLQTLRCEGQERMPVDEGARSILREWMRSAMHGKNTGRIDVFPTPPPSASPAPSTPPAPPASSQYPTQAPADAPEKQAGILTTVEEKLAYLRQMAENRKSARALGTLRDTMVFAVGNPHARLMLVGEAPGYDEERLGEPFVGRAGQKLNQILAAMGLKREDVYISNVCKFRPSMGANQGTANRPPSEQEIAACLPIILAEIRAIRPECIVCLGGSSAKGLLGAAQSVTSMRGQWLDCQGVPVRVTYHPSYLLRNESPRAKRAVWEDMLAVMEKLGMPVSERQRHYFL